MIPRISLERTDLFVKKEKENRRAHTVQSQVPGAQPASPVALRRLTRVLSRGPGLCLQKPEGRIDSTSLKAEISELFQVGSKVLKLSAFQSLLSFYHGQSRVTSRLKQTIRLIFFLQCI